MSLENSPSFLLNLSEVDLDRKSGPTYTFRSFSLNISERRLSQDGASIPLTPKSFDVLAYLVERSGRLVEKDELMESIWPDTVVEESNLARIVHTLRKQLGEDRNGNKFIETVSKKGYRFVAEVEVASIEHGTSTTNDLDGIAAASIEAPVSMPPLRAWLILVAGAVVVMALVIGIAAWSRRDQPIPTRSGNLPETTSGEAYQLYAQGRTLVERRYKGDYLKALEFFEKAVELDPNYANALAGLADVKTVIFWGSSSHKDISEARTAVRRAIEVDPANAYARTMYCRILTTYDWDHKAAEDECTKAVELDPESHQAQRELAMLLSSLGREAEAIQAMDRAVASAPTSFNKRTRGMILYYFRRYDEAIAQLEQVSETDLNYQDAVRWLMKSYEMKGDHRKALEAYLRFVENSGESSSDEAANIRSLFQSDGWPGVLRNMIGRKGLGAVYQAAIYAQLGETDLAFNELERAYERKIVLLVTIPREPALDPIRSDPRYADLLRRIGLSQ